MTSATLPNRAFDRALVRTAVLDAFRKLSPRMQFRNPVMFVVLVCSILTTLIWIAGLAGHREVPSGFSFAVSAWLWFTLLFANFAEALAEGRGKAQANALRGSRKELIAKRVRVSVIEPGTVATELATHLRAEIREAAQRQTEGIQPLLPEDIADAVAWIVTRDRRVAVNEILVRASEQTW